MSRLARRPLILGLAGAAAVALVAGLVCARGRAAGPPDAGGGPGAGVRAGYVHLSTDPDRAADRRFARLAGSLPPVRRLRDGVLRALAPGRRRRPGA